jgi:ribosomal protein S18 acetylase RimI-like enzyme
MIRFRKGGPDDVEFIRQMLFEAFFWDPDLKRPDPDDFFKQNELDFLLAGWGRKGDHCVIAWENGIPVGAAWFRLWTEARHFYGFIGPDIPELGMAVKSSHRSKGIGRQLLERLIDVASSNNFKALSLSVDPSNFAVKLYESVGFRKVKKSGSSWTYLLSL